MSSKKPTPPSIVQLYEGEDPSSDNEKVFSASGKSLGLLFFLGMAVGAICMYAIMAGN